VYFSSQVVTIGKIGADPASSSGHRAVGLSVRSAGIAAAARKQLVLGKLWTMRDVKQCRLMIDTTAYAIVLHSLLCITFLRVYYSNNSTIRLLWHQVVQRTEESLLQSSISSLQLYERLRL